MFCFFSYDNVYIFEQSSLITGPNCGFGAPPNFTSTGNSITITFKSDEVVETSGFQFDYKCRDIVCDAFHPDVWQCCTSSNPCDEGQGHCSREDECLGIENLHTGASSF